MNAHELVASLSRDLRLDGTQRYELQRQAARFAVLGDDEVRAEARQLSGRLTDPLLAGAVAVLATGMVEERYSMTLDTPAREAYEASLTPLGTRGGAYDSGRQTGDVAEALGRAADLEATGIQENKAVAASIRQAVERAQREGER